jgi:hypothetical protein
MRGARTKIPNGRAGIVVRGADALGALQLCRRPRSARTVWDRTGYSLQSLGSSRATRTGGCARRQNYIRLGRVVVLSRRPAVVMASPQPHPSQYRRPRTNVWVWGATPIPIRQR